MTEPLTQNWPDEPDRTDVEALARQLASSLPTLSAESMHRIEQTMQQAMIDDSRQRRRRRALVQSGVAAGLLAAAGAIWLSLGQRQAENPPLVAPAVSEVVRDVYPISPPPQPAPGVQDRPLIALDEYHSLFDH